MYVDVGAWSDLSYPSGAVVVGWNGKDHSRPALSWGVREAARREAPLLVLYAAHYPGMDVEPGPGLLRREPGALDAAQEVTARGVGDALRSGPGLWVSGATEVTSPAQALVGASTDAALLVLGSRGRGRVTGALLGSVAVEVAARAACPVVVVKDEDAEETAGTSSPVVLGTDGSAQADAALEFAAEHAAAVAAPLEVVSCAAGGSERDLDADPRAAADRLAAGAADRARAVHPELTVSSRVAEDLPEVALVEASERAALVVVGTRGRGAFRGMLLGSVSHAVIRGARCAVAVVDDTARGRR
jgi:nucleotide-binding universal stress UspA family protein